MATDKQIGTNIRRLREAKGLSQADLAERLGDGFHQQTVGKIETGARPLRLSEASQLSLVFGVGIASLAQDDDDAASATAALIAARSRVSDTCQQIRDLAYVLADQLVDLAFTANVKGGKADSHIVDDITGGWLTTDYGEMLNGALVEKYRLGFGELPEDRRDPAKMPYQFMMSLIDPSKVGDEES